MHDLTPRQIVEELNRHIVGQNDAKRAVAIAVRNRWRRQQLPSEVRSEISPKNILMIGPTGVGKTEIARRLAKLTGAPFIKVEATKFTEVGYYGRDVESMARELVDNAIALVREQERAKVQQEAKERVTERLVKILLPGRKDADDELGEPSEKKKRTRERLRTRLEAGEFEDQMVELHVEQKAMPLMLTGSGLEQFDMDLQGMFQKMLPRSSTKREMMVKEARNVLFEQECEALINQENLHQTALALAENLGIIFLDEIDKIVARDSAKGADVSRQGVQRDLLPLVEGTSVQTKYGYLKTDHVLFIAAGAFHNSSPSDLMPELQGRFPIRVELTALTKEDFIRILTEPKNAITKQDAQLLATEGLTVTFTEDAIEALAGYAFQVNHTTQNIGARRLYTIVERVLDEISFNAPDAVEKNITIDRQYVEQALASLTKDEDLSRFIL